LFLGETRWKVDIVKTNVKSKIDCPNWPRVTL
jgi:hypothetical protein